MIVPPWLNFLNVLPPFAYRDFDRGKFFSVVRANPEYDYRKVYHSDADGVTVVWPYNIAGLL